jgi:hypothetical protein
MNGHSIFSEVRTVLLQLTNTLLQLHEDEYTIPLEILSNSSIGEHSRHIIELFEIPIKQYESGIIDYDNRKRNVKIQTEIDFAVECIYKIISEIEKPNKPLEILFTLNASKTVDVTLSNHQIESVQSNYLREILYNLEHCIHHQAIIKIGLKYLAKNIVDENFGVAKSTINYRTQCVQ